MSESVNSAQFLTFDTPVTSGKPIYVLNADFRDVCTPFQVPQLEVIIKTVMELFVDDPALTLLPLWGRGLGVFKIILLKPLAMPLPIALEFQVPAVRRKNETTVVKVPFIVPPGREDMDNFRDRKTGVLVTIQRAALGANRTLNNSDFDEVMKEHGQIVKMTALQNHRGTQCLNGNRYCVIDPTGKGTLPSTISVKHPVTGTIIQFYTRFKGQEWHCRRCDSLHVGRCPVAKEFFRLQEERKNEVITTKIASDSTLRNVHQLGLKAEVMAMSGGRIGHVANAVRDDPGIDNIKNIIVVAGQNDLSTPYQTNQQFAFGIHKGIDKVLHLKEDDPERVVTFVHIKPPSTADPRTQIRAKYLEKTLLEYQNETTQVIVAANAEVEFDKTDHPTLRGTRDLLNLVEAEGTVKIIKEEAYMTTSTLYQGVDPIYIFGCTSCDKLGTFVDGWGYCPECFKEMEAYVSPAMEELEEQMRGPPPVSRLPKRKVEPKGEIPKKGAPPKYKSKLEKLGKMRRSNSLTEKQDGGQKMEE